MALARLPRRLVVGLGNVGPAYDNTRHNIGFAVLDRMASQYLPLLTRVPVAHGGLSPRGAPLAWTTCDALKGDVLDAVLHFQPQPADLVDARSERRRARTVEEGVPYPAVEARLLKPSTLMNRSGNAVRCSVDGQNLRLKRNMASLNKGDEVVVVTDDLSLPFGTCKIMSRGGHGGHNGLRDIERRLGTRSYTRLRLGIAPVHGGSARPDVLGRFTGQEQVQLPAVIDDACEYLRVYLHRGFDAAAVLANTTKA